MDIFKAKNFTYPYRDLIFPGQHTEEIILFACREGKVMVYLRWLIIIIGALVLFIIRFAGGAIVRDNLETVYSAYQLLSLAFILSFTGIGLYWIYILWRKSVFIVTTRRLTKFIHTTPWNRYQLSLGLDKIVDTGSYQKGLIHAIFRLGYFVARSSAGNIKNFKILNISYAEDLQNYINKLLFTFNKETEKLDTFRPFVPNLKGEARKQFVRSVTPEYYQDTNSRPS